MPARRRTGGPPSVDSTNSDDAYSEQYKLKRQRNNDAVRKTRAKTKETASKRKQHVENLQKENAKLEAMIEQASMQVQSLKDILLHNVANEEEKKLKIQQILEEEDSDDD